MRASLLFAVSTLAVTLAGGLVLWRATDGFSAFTTETVRRLAVSRSPRTLPDAVLEDHQGRRFRLSELRERMVLVDFVYTRCPSTCLSLGVAFRRIAEALPEKGALGDAVLVSVSFDHRRDDVAALAGYAGLFGADGNRWRVARVVEPEDLEALLGAFGIVVIPDEFGGFQHNAAIHLVDRDGRLARVFDPGAVGAALAEVERRL